MKTRFSAATLVATLVVLGLQSSANAQTAQGTNVAVLDLARVFKDHRRFNAQMEDVKRDVTNLEGFFRNERTKMENLAKELELLKPGTPDYKAKESQLAAMQADIQVQIQLKRKEVLEREARLRYDAYEEVVKAVARFSQQHGISLVIRFNSEPIDKTNPQAVQLGINRPIVYQHKLDITNWIIGEVNRGQAPQNAGNGPVVPRR